MSPLTRAERSNYHETSLHSDVMAFVAALDSKADPRLHVEQFGESGEGRALQLLILSAAGVRTPSQARATGLPVVLVMCGIHAGEVEGKEGALIMVRDLLNGSRPDLADLLEHVVLLLVPLFNPDGNDRIDPGNRRLHLPKLEGQLGPPTGVGTRTNASGINLNRDYMRHESPEMRLLQQRVCQPWAPDLTIDNHATNGSVHRYAMTYDVPHTIASGRSEPIVWMRDRLLPAVTAAMRANHSIETGWYGNFVEDERALDGRRDADPTAPVAEGWMTYPHHPRFGGNYRGLTGRMDLLLECYSYISFEERVHTARTFMEETLAFVAAHSDEVQQTIALATTPPPTVAVRSRLEVAPQPLTILTRTPRTLDGAPSQIELPHFARFVGTTVIERPRAYLVPPAVARHLMGHGLSMREPSGSVDAQIATVEGYGSEGGRKILEASTVGELQVSWASARRAPPEGWVEVDTSQPLGAIAVYLCEPESDDGAVENGVIAAPAIGAEFPVWRAE
jgi:Zinc carboxypeptidase